MSVGRPKKKSEYLMFNGEYFSEDPKTGYWQHTKTRERMHRYVWRHYYGDIPRGFHIHHIDGDKSNNDISNLTMLTPKAHSKIHKELRSDETYAKLKENCDNIRHLTKAWHSSEEGRKWHKEHFEKTKDKVLAKREFTCELCGKSFIARVMGRNRFCSNACKSKWRYVSGIDNVERVCEVCGKTFTANKYSKARTCSRKCAQQLRKII